MTSSSSSSSASTELAASAMTMPELRLHVVRCERLVQNPGLLTRLKDGGADIRRRFSLFTAEIARRESQSSVPTDDAARPDSKAENESAAAEAAAVELRGEAAAQRAIAEKHKDYRVPVETIARQMYEGSLSEREIQRILAEVPPNYFLTSAETQAMLQKSAKEARRSQLEALRQQMAETRPPASPTPP